MLSLHFLQSNWQPLRELRQKVPHTCLPTITAFHLFLSNIHKLSHLPNLSVDPSAQKVSHVQVSNSEWHIKLVFIEKLY